MSIQKKCWNCKEVVHSYASHCPYCRVEISKATPDEENKDSLLPPYRLVNSSFQEEAAPSSLYSTKPMDFNDNDEAVDHSCDITALPYSEDDEAIKPESQNIPAVKNLRFGNMKQVMTPLLMLLSGSVFFMFGLVLLLYSRHGVFTLRWNGNNWPYFLFSSLPLLLFGWRMLLKVEDPDDAL